MGGGLFGRVDVQPMRLGHIEFRLEINNGGPSVG